MIVHLLLIALGIVLLIKGADWLVEGASTLAKRFHVSDLAIGLTVVAFGTSAPELVVNAFAAFDGHADIVFGNIIGSNNFNLFMILGLVGIISPLVVQSSTVWKEIPFSFLAILVLFALVGIPLGASLPLSRIDGLILLVMFGLFLFYIYKQLRVDPLSLSIETKSLSTSRMVIYIIIGLAALVGGGKLVVDSAIGIATVLGVSQKIIGLTVVAAGTSLPELVTSLVAAKKGKNDIAVGNIIGSNIFNVFLILGVSSIIRPIAYDPKFNQDLIFLAAGTIFLFGMMFIGRKKVLQRWQASVLLLAFVVYTIFLIS